MLTKQLCKLLTKFSKFGTLEDLRALYSHLESLTNSAHSLDLDLRVALKVGERCIILQEGLSVNPVMDALFRLVRVELYQRGGICKYLPND
jgi:hypothetical protein